MKKNVRDKHPGSDTEFTRSIGPGEPIIEFSHFGWQYSAQMEPTLTDINLTIRRGEKILIAGPSGCGKSTIVSCINGLIPFTYKGEATGSLKVAGRETRDLSIFDLAHTVGTVLQDSDAQFIGMSVREDIAFSLENECTPQDEMIRRVLETAQIVDMTHRLGNAPSEVSGGQKQRVSIAGILVNNVDVLLFDEPLANLDPATGKVAMELIDDLQKQTGAAVVIVEHRLEDAMHRQVDRVVVMGEGRIVYDGTPEELLSTDLLTQQGIREPLYCTALKYAGVTITPDMNPDMIRTLQISEENKDRVRKWFHRVKTPERPAPGEVFLSLKDVEFAYDGKTDILKGVTLDIRAGEMVALVGKNGAGKSTLSKVICGFEKPSSGSMTLEGQDMSTLSIKERADRIGYVMQNPNKMISKPTVMEEVSLGLVARGVPEEEIKERVLKILEVCGLRPYRSWPISALSYGMKKRVTIASILVLDPKMLILDEPTAGQDYRHYTEIMEFLEELNRKGYTILMITHDMHLMLEYAHRSIVFYDGQVIADATSAWVLTNPEVIERANLKETSLYHLALRCGLEDPSAFAQCFIDYEKELRG